jgi:FlgN protein
VTSETTQICGLLEKRLSLLDSLAVELRACGEAMVGLDFDGIHRRVAQQEQICQQIRYVDRDIENLQHRWTEGESDHSFPAAQELLGRITSAQAEVRRLNCAHAALLRRSRRTLRAMMNFVNFYGSTYDAKQEAAVKTESSSELARV